MLLSHHFPSFPLPLLALPHTRLKWMRMADLPVPMTLHHIVKIGDNIYCGGGFTGNIDRGNITPETQVFLYRPLEDTWVQLKPNCPTLQFGLTQLNEKLVTVGGRQYDQPIPITDVYTFQPESEECGVWNNEPIPPLQTARFFPTAFNYRSALVVSGGYTSWNGDINNSTRANVVEVFQSNTRQWYYAEPLPCAHSSMSCAVVDDTYYLIGGVNSGGASRNVYCTSINNLVPEISSTSQASPSPFKWQDLDECPYYYSTAVEIGGYLLAIGGNNQESNDCSSAIHVYSPSSKKWVRTSSGDLPVPRSTAAATHIGEGKVIFVGGEDNPCKPKRSVFIASLEQ